MTYPPGSKRLATYLFLVTSTTAFLQPFLPLLMEAAKVNRVQIGLVLGLGTGLGLTLQPTLGRLSDRLDARRPFIIVCALAAASAYFAMPYAQGLWQFLALAALGNFGTIYLNSAAAVLAARMIQASKSGGLYGSLRVWGSVGYIVTAVVIGLLITRGGSTGTTLNSLGGLFRYGPLLFLAIAAMAWSMVDRKTPQVERDHPAKAPLPKNLRTFLWAYFLYNLALYGALNFLSIYLKQLGSNGLWITVVFAAGVVSEAIVMRRSGGFSDRYGRRPALAFAFLMLPLRLLLYVPATGPLWVMGVQMMHGFNFGIVGIVAVAFATDMATDRTIGHAQSRLFVVLGLSSAVGPILLGAIAQAAGLRGMFAVAALVGAAGAAIMFFAVDDSHPESETFANRMPPHMRRFFGSLDKRPTMPRRSG